MVSEHVIGDRVSYFFSSSVLAEILTKLSLWIHQVHYNGVVHLWRGAKIEIEGFENSSMGVENGIEGIKNASTGDKN